MTPLFTAVNCELQTAAFGNTGEFYDLLVAVMDAPEDNRDIKLYRASADLLPDISRRLDELLTNGSDTGKPVEHPLWVADSQTQKLISLLDPFQEWPQLLDPLLQKLVHSSAEVFLQCLVVGRYQDELQSAPHLTVVSTLPCAICCILNTLCKIRGAKVITRFLDNEPKYLEPMLRALFLNRSNMVWQERYIMLLWLSHLVLTPFDLQSISSSDECLFTEARFPAKVDHEGIPVIARGLMSAGLQNLGVASKERESASHLLVRIALRPDMQRLGLLDDLVKLMFTKLHEYAQEPTSSVYECLGYLSVLSGVIKAGSADDVLPFLTSTFDLALKAATTELAGFITIRASAPARKMLVTILRTSTLHAISLNSRDGAKAISDGTLYAMLEGFIQYLLDALADKDTPVRLASGKALSMLAQKLDEDMRDEVVQAILDSLEDDVSYEKPDSGEPVPVRLVTSEDMRSMSRNVTAVNPLKWQGLLLTLGHLLFRRTAPPDKLSPILKSLLSGLSFEQRTAGGTSIGVYVRDAACFGLWSLARKYSTSDLQAIEPASVLPTLEATFATSDETSVLQIVADQLLVSACLDPSGNIRRGSSAALQELIGRHPDTIIQGIALVQVVDYHAVARRSHAMLDVAKGAAELAPVYRWALLNALLGWRGVRAVDDDSRRIAAAAISELVSLGTFSDRLTILQTVQMQLGRLPPHSAKTVVEIRHGLLITISRLLDTMEAASVVEVSSTATSPVAALLQLLWEGIRVDNQVLGNLNVRFVSELVLEGAACLVSAVVRRMSECPLRLSEQGIEVLDVCLTKADHDVALLACADAAFQLFSRLRVEQRVGLVGNWVDSAQQRHPSSSSKGRILALGAVYTTLPDNMTADQTEDNGNCRNRVFALLAEFLQGDWPIETQVTALRSLNSMIPHLRKENLEKPLCAALDNYANDQRGDIGSLVRMEAVKTVVALIREFNRRPSAMANQTSLQPFLLRLFRLAGEKLDKLRFEAWNCIALFLTAMKVQSAQRVSHVIDVSSHHHFVALLRFLQVPWLQSCILQGIVHSIASGTEDLMRVSRSALVDSIFNHLQDHRAMGALETLVTLLENSYLDDRQATPCLETIAFVLEQSSELEGHIECRFPARRIWNVVRKAHFKSTNIRRLEAAVKIYGALARQGDMRRNTLGKLKDLLLHPYPSIRNAAADALYTDLPNEVISREDWLRPPAELKGAILKLNEAVSERAGTA